MGEIFKASWDQNGDVLTIYRDGSVRESIEVAENLIIDVDKNMKLINLELLDAFDFLYAMNKEITKDVLNQLKEAEPEVANYRNYWIISIAIKGPNGVIKEKLPAFASSNFKNPLIASISS